MVIIPSDYGNRATPSYIQLSDEAPVLGDPAKNMWSVYPRRTVFEITRVIGLLFSSPITQKYKQLWSFDVVEGVEGAAMVSVPDSEGRQRLYSTRELLRILLAHLKVTAEKFLGSEVTSAVITVPAHFNLKQRHEVFLAGSEAGITVNGLMNESVAVCVPYGLKYADEESVLLVYDFGAGALEVSLVVIDDGVCEVLAIATDNTLGGADLDTELVKYYVRKFNDRHRVEVQTNQRAMCRLRSACERAKRSLSTKTEALIEIDSLLNGINFNETISRAKFEEINGTLFGRCLLPVDIVLQESHKESTDVNRVVLAGGCTHIPKIQQYLSDKFSSEKICGDINFQEAAVYGATVIAEIRSGTCFNEHDKLNDFLLLEVLSHTVGVETGGVTGVVSPIATKNTTLPMKKCTMFTTTRNNQTTMELRIFEGERALARDNVFLETILIEEIPMMPAGIPCFSVAFINGTAPDDMNIEVECVMPIPQDATAIRVTKVKEQRSRQLGTEVALFIPILSDTTPPPSPQRNPLGPTTVRPEAMNTNHNSTPVSSPSEQNNTSSSPSPSPSTPTSRVPPTTHDTPPTASPPPSPPRATSSTTSNFIPAIPIPSAPPMPTSSVSSDMPDPPPTSTPLSVASTPCPIINWADLKLENVLARGAFSIVHKASWRGSSVAVKVIRTALPGGDLSFERELSILSSLRHPRLLSLMGVSRDVPPEQGSVGLVVEYMLKGTVFSALRLLSTVPLADVERLHIAADIADGMRFLHHSNVIHRDLKSSNVLLDSKGQAKVCDFGLSAVKDAAMSHVTGVTGTAAWTAPEALSGSRVHSSCDVYSFGVILWELVTGNIPWEGLSTVQVVCQVVAMNARLPLPAAVNNSNLRSEEVCDLIKRCFSSEDYDGEVTRPTFDAIHSTLHRLLVAEQRTANDASNILSRAQECMICPISFEIMTDPVICSDGHSYERVFIEEWLQESEVSPMTGAPLLNTTLIPNHSLKSLINSLTGNANESSNKE